MSGACVLAWHCLIQPVSRNTVKRCVYTQVKASHLELVGFPPEPQMDVVRVFFWLRRTAFLLFVGVVVFAVKQDGLL